MFLPESQRQVRWPSHFRLASEPLRHGWEDSAYRHMVPQVWTATTRKYAKSAHPYRDSVAEHVESWSYMKFTFIKKPGWKGFEEGTAQHLQRRPARPSQRRRTHRAVHHRPLVSRPGNAFAPGGSHAFRHMDESSSLVRNTPVVCRRPETPSSLGFSFATLTFALPEMGPAHFIPAT